MTTRELYFGCLPRSIQILIFSVAVACLAFVFYAYHLKDLVRERDAIRAEIGRLQLSVAQTTAIESQLEDSKQKLIRLEERLEVLKSILPAQQETSEVLRSVQQMAASSNLRINKFSPGPAVPKDLYSDWPIQIIVEGNYDGLGLFFEKVSRAARIINIGNLSIKGSEKRANPGLTLTASCTATTFVFREEPFDSPVSVSDKAEDTTPYPGFRAGRPERVVESAEISTGVRYLDAGRRDPFLNPLFMKKSSGTRDEEVIPVRRPAGITGTYIAELSFEGTCSGGGRRLAVLRSADKRAYFLEEGDRLYDGYLKAILADSIILVRETRFKSGKVLTQDVIKRLTRDSQEISPLRVLTSFAP